MPSPTRAPVIGSSADDLLVAHPEPSRLLGMDGNDVLIDGPGSDSLLGGAGNNRLFGGPGNDYYTHDHLAAGRDTILDFDPTPGNIDTLIVNESLEAFGPFERYQDDLLIGLNGEPAAINVQYFFRDAAFRIERFRFGATHITDKDILRNFHLDPDAPPSRSADDPPVQASGRMRLSGSGKADRLVAADQPTYLLGRGGNDLLIGSRASDVLDGGASLDMFLGDNHENLLFGGPGNDYYNFSYNADYSRQVILDYDPTPGNLDTLNIRGDVRPADVRFSGGQGGSLYLEFDNEQRITIENYFLDKAFVIEKIRFDDGSVLTEAYFRKRFGLPPRTARAELSVLPHDCVAAPSQLPVDTPLGLLMLAGAALSQLCG